MSTSHSSPLPEEISTSSQKISRQHPTCRPPEVDQYVDAFLSAVCDTSRRYILELLAQPKEGEEHTLPEKRSGEIASAIGLAPATTSEHLRHLLRAGLLTSRRDGNMIYYSLRNHTLVHAFQELMEALDNDYYNEQGVRLL